jgi:transposase InsO family protein
MFIHNHKEEFPVLRMCQVLEVSESGYYAWLQRGPSRREQVDRELGERIEDAYRNNRQVYGSPRLHAELKEQGVHCGRKRVARLMRERGITAKAKRRKMKTTDSRHDNPVAPNLLERDFTADAPNTKWVSDITGIETLEGWLYLAAIVDIYSRFVVGWSMGKERDEQLITKAAEMALARRHPGAGLLHHSDRGSQYTSEGYQTLLKQHGIEISMSRKGDCYDNALMESFFGTFKEECVERQKFQTRSEAKQIIFEYLEVFYNRQRKHSSLGYVSPAIYEKMKGEINIGKT